MYNFEYDSPDFLPHLSAKISFTLEDGDGLVISGENGIGKSTLLDKLFLKYSSSCLISILDQKPFDDFYDRRLGDLKKIFFLARLDFIERDQFDFLWKIFGLDQKEQLTLSGLSGGEMQCLKICMALSRKAKVFFLDEPFQSLDLEKRNFLIRFLEELRFKSKSLVIVEHQLVMFDSSWKRLSLVIKNGSLEREL
jgi:ABC-type multidrug transport system ATPase subunit